MENRVSAMGWQVRRLRFLFISFLSSVFLERKKCEHSVCCVKHRCYRGSHKINAVARVFAVFCVTILRPHGFISDLISTPRSLHSTSTQMKKPKYGPVSVIPWRTARLLPQWKFVFCVLCAKRQSKIVQLLAIESQLNSRKFVAYIHVSCNRISHSKCNWTYGIWKIQRKRIFVTRALDANDMLGNLLISSWR